MRIAFDDEEFVLIVEDHTEDGASHVEPFEETPVAVEDLDSATRKDAPAGASAGGAAGGSGTAGVEGAVETDGDGAGGEGRIRKNSSAPRPKTSKSRTVHLPMRPAAAALIVEVPCTRSGTITDWPQNRHCTTVPASRLYSSGPLHEGQLNVSIIVSLAGIDKLA